MNHIAIKQAHEDVIPVLEGILLDTVNWLNEMDQPLWGEEDVKWEALSKNYLISDFYIAYSDDRPSGCVAIVDHDPFMWPDVKKGDSLFIHKLAVAGFARKAGIADALMVFFQRTRSSSQRKNTSIGHACLAPKGACFL